MRSSMGGAQDAGSRFGRCSTRGGKPMCRFQRSSTTVFGCKRPLPAEDLDDDVVYAKVQHVAWEKDIIWGFEFETDRRQTSMETVVEEHDVEDDLHWREATTELVTNSISRESTSMLWGYTQASTRPAKRHQSTKPIESLWTYSTVEDDFDMTKSGQYRWELPVPTNKTYTKHNAYDPLPCPLNKALDDGSWVAAIGWNSTHDMSESKLILDDNDVSLILTTMDTATSTLGIHTNELSATEDRRRQLEEQRQAREARLESARQAIGVGDRERCLNPSTDNDSARKRVVRDVGLVHHSLPAVKLSMTKPELPKAKLREFHRPRSKFKINERMVFAQPPVVPVPPVEEGAVVTQIKKSSDLNLTAGGKIILVEYTEQNPPMLSNPGMASRVLHYWRPPDNEEDTMVGKKKVKKAKPKAPEMKMGQVITLGHHDETPFVGDVPPGRVVTSLNSKLYKVPIFQHKPVAPFAPSTAARESGQYELFLVCRSVSKGKKGAAIGESAKTTLYIFEMPDLYLAGQVEPQIEVPAPNSDLSKKFIQSYMAFHVSRLFTTAVDGRLKIDVVERAFPSQSSTMIRKVLRRIATFERGGNDGGSWTKKAIINEDATANITPESVCLNESMMAGQRRLLDAGVTKPLTVKGVDAAIQVLLRRLERRKQLLSAALIAPFHLIGRAKEAAEQRLWKRDTTLCRLETDIQIARYMRSELQLTPWNMTANYVECHLQGKGLLALGGHGDPSGRGEGFSFVRASTMRGKKVESKGAVANVVASITGTTADLRKLKMKEAGNVLRHLGVPEAEIAKLKRWERIQKLREMSTVANARGEGGALSKFARGARKSLSGQQQAYRRACNAIYERQMNVLSSNDVSFSDDEESGDDSEIIDELEDELLGAGSFSKDDREKIVKLGPRNLFTKGGGGLNRSKEALAEREDAVELERLMKEMKEDSGVTCASKLLSLGETSSRVVPGRKVLKRTTHVVEEDGSETVRIEFIVDDKQVARFQAKTASPRPPP